MPTNRLAVSSDLWYTGNVALFVASETEQHMQLIALRRWIEAAGLSSFTPLMLDVVRAFRLLGSQALLIAQPLLRGIIDDATVMRGLSLLEGTDLLGAHLEGEGNRR